MTQYSQMYQDLWVLHHTAHKRGGVFVDIGAHDGKQFSNTYLLETEYDWTGVCVECNSDTYPALTANRDHCMPYAAWSHSNQLVNFHHHPTHAMLSGITQHTADTVLETRSLNDIIAEADIGTDIDYISLDTEGSEVKILSTFDMERHNVKCWSVEHNHNGEALNYMIDFFQRHGYLWRLWQWDILAVKDGGIHV